MAVTALFECFQPLHLPVGCHVDTDYLKSMSAYAGWIVVVENWKRLNELSVLQPAQGDRPLIVWRAGTAGSIRADAMLAWLDGLPV